MLYVPSVNRPTVMLVLPPDKAPYPVTDRFAGRRILLNGPEGLPLLKPPYGRITAIRMNTGDHAWVVPSGTGPREHPLLKDLN